MSSASADHAIDLGPGAGAKGGRVVTQETPEEVADSPNLFDREISKATYTSLGQCDVTRYLH